MSNNFLWEKFLDLLYPKQCVYCHHVGEYLCSFCQERLEFINLPIELHNLKTCYLDGAYALAAYQEPFSLLIQTLKYQSVKGIGQFLGQLLWQYGHFPLSEHTYLCPIPIHQQRLLERGFNQAEEIALGLEKAGQLPLLNLLIKQTNTKHQAESQNKQQRLEQLKDSFTINEKNFQQLSQPCLSSIILIDDVITTGATMNECAKILKQAGIKKVFGLATAHEG